MSLAKHLSSRRSLLYIFVFAAVVRMVAAIAHMAHMLPMDDIYSQAKADNYKNFAAYRQSDVALWAGMTRDEFNAKTSEGKEGTRLLQYGQYTLTFPAPEFDGNGGLTSATGMYEANGTSDAQAAYSAYLKAANATPDRNLGQLPSETLGTVALKDGTALSWVSSKGTVTLVRAESGPSKEAPEGENAVALVVKAQSK